MAKKISQLLFFSSIISVCSYSFTAYAIPLHSSIKIDKSTATIINIKHKEKVEIYNILGGTKRGENLFHSFREFSILGNKKAKFNATKNIKNIYARVTGNKSSIISNILEVNAKSKTNFFLINPNGFIFNKSAKLITRGSVFLSTASSINFSDNFKFSSIETNAKIPLLTIQTPIGLSFELPTRSITFDKNSEGSTDFLGLKNPNDEGSSFTEGQTLAFLGGELKFRSKSIANNGGIIDLGAISKGETVTIREKKSRIIVDYQQTKKYGNIWIRDSFIFNTNSSIGFGNINLYGKK